MVLFQDRLSWYRDDSKNEPLGQFRFRPLTEVLLTRDLVELTLKTPSSDQWGGSFPAEKAEKVVLRADAHNASVELQEWQDAIREQLRRFAAMSYAPRAEDALILENGLAIGLCTEAELKVGQDTAIRGHCECCGQTAPPPFAPRQCKRCARLLCVTCVPHTAFSYEEAVVDNESVSEPQCNHPICVECFEDVANRLRRTVVDGSERRYLQQLNEQLQPWEQQQTTRAKAEVKQRLEAEHSWKEEQLNAIHAADMAALRAKIFKAKEETRARQMDVERAQIAAQAAEEELRQDHAAIHAADVAALRAKIVELRQALALRAGERERGIVELRQALTLKAGERERGRPPLHHVPSQAQFQWLRQQGRRLMGRRAHADDGALPCAGGAASVALHPLDAMMDAQLAALRAEEEEDDAMMDAKLAALRREEEEDDAMMEAQIAALRAEEEERVAMQPAPRLPPYGSLQPPVEHDWLQGLIQAFQDLSQRFIPNTIDFLRQWGGSLVAEPRPVQGLTQSPNDILRQWGGCPEAEPRPAPGHRELAMGLVFPTEFALERLERRAFECLLLESEVRARLEMAAKDAAEQRICERGQLDTDLLRLQGAAEAAVLEADAGRQRERAAREEQARREEERRREEQGRLRREREEAERQKREREAHEQVMREHNRRLKYAAGVAHCACQIEPGAQFARHELTPQRSFDPKNVLDAHFRLCESHVLRQLGHASKRLVRVEYVVNPPLIRQFEQQLEDFERAHIPANMVLAFHATRERASVDNIVQHNFDPRRIGSQTDSGWWGRGFYFSEYPATSLGYGSNMLLCRVLPGKTYDVTQRMDGQPLRAGFNSHRLQADANGYGQELVIDNPKQILPCYILHFQ